MSARLLKVNQRLAFMDVQFRHGMSFHFDRVIEVGKCETKSSILNRGGIRTARIGFSYSYR